MLYPHTPTHSRGKCSADIGVPLNSNNANSSITSTCISTKCHYISAECYTQICMADLYTNKILSNVLLPARGVVWGGDQHAMEFLAKCLTLGFAHVSCLFKSLFICKMLKKSVVMTLTVDIRDSIHKLHPGSL